MFLALSTLYSYGTYLVTGVLGAEHAALEIAFAPLTFWMFLGPLYVIGLFVYLPLVTLIPRQWPGRRRRVMALLLSPVVGSALWFVTSAGVATAAFAVLLPLLYGAIVRLIPSSGSGMSAEPGQT